MFNNRNSFIGTTIVLHGQYFSLQDHRRGRRLIDYSYRTYETPGLYMPYLSVIN